MWISEPFWHWSFSGNRYTLRKSKECRSLKLCPVKVLNSFGSKFIVSIIIKNGEELKGVEFLPVILLNLWEFTISLATECTSEQCSFATLCCMRRLSLWNWANCVLWSSIHLKRAATRIGKQINCHPWVRKLLLRIWPLARSDKTLLHIHAIHFKFSLLLPSQHHISLASLSHSHPLLAAFHTFTPVFTRHIHARPHSTHSHSSSFHTYTPICTHTSECSAKPTTLPPPRYARWLQLFIALSTQVTRSRTPQEVLRVKVWLCKGQEVPLTFHPLFSTG